MELSLMDLADETRPKDIAKTILKIIREQAGGRVPIPVPVEKIAKLLDIIDIEYEDFPIGLNEDIIRAISAKKEEPEWMTDWRLESFRIWQKMEEPDWANIKYQKPDFQAIRYYAAPKAKPELASLDEVDPELLKTFAKLGINIEEQKRLANVAVDIVVDSVSVKTTFQETLKEKGIIFCSISEAIKEHPDLVKQYLGKVVPRGDNFYAALNSAVYVLCFLLMVNS